MPWREEQRTTGIKCLVVRTISAWQGKGVLASWSITWPRWGWTILRSVDGILALATWGNCFTFIIHIHRSSWEHHWRSTKHLDALKVIAIFLNNTIHATFTPCSKVNSTLLQCCYELYAMEQQMGLQPLSFTLLGQKAEVSGLSCPYNFLRELFHIDFPHPHVHPAICL